MEQFQEVDVAKEKMRCRNGEKKDQSKWIKHQTLQLNGKVNKVK